MNATCSSAPNSAHKKISLYSAVMLCGTSAIGSGWLFSAQLTAKLAGNYAFLAWVLAALLIMAVGLCLAQVVAVYPVRGATTRSSSLSHNHIFGMPFAFANWFGLMIAVAAEAQATTQYLASVSPRISLIGTDNHFTIYGKIFGLFLLFLYLMINYFGARVLAKINNPIAVIKVLSPLLVVSVFLIAYFDKSNFTSANAADLSYGPLAAVNAIVGGGLIYSYNGFQLVVSYASEIINPKRNVALAIIISVGILLLFYLLLQLAFMGAVPHELLAAGWAHLNFQSPLVNLTMLLGLNLLTLILLADSALSPSVTGYAYLGGVSRQFYAMAAAKQLPQWMIGELHPVYNLCRRSLLINWGLAAVVLWNSDTWAVLMVVTTGYHLIGYMAAPISMGAIKPATRIFGLFMFVLLSLLMTTMPQHDLLVMNLSLLGVMLIFCFVQLQQKIPARNLLYLVSPFLIYLWLIYFFPQWYAVVAISIVFYGLTTNLGYVEFCKINKYDLYLPEDLAAVQEAQGSVTRT